MSRASYQRIDNIRIGESKSIAANPVKKSRTSVKPPLQAVTLAPRKERPYRPVLHLKV